LILISFRILKNIVNVGNRIPCSLHIAGFSLCGKVACGLLHDRLSHPKRAFLDLKGTTAAGSVCHHSKPQSPVKPSSSLPMTHFLSCGAYLQPWDKNSYDLRHLQESTVKGRTLSFARTAGFLRRNFYGP